MSVIITGSAGLIGSESARFFCERGYHVVGIDNDLRSRFFGPEASTRPVHEELSADYRRYQHHDIDIRDQAAVEALVARTDVELLIHTAAQPSHDWAAREPHTDFHVNATGTLNLLEALRKHHPQAVFIFTSTNKVYGDLPNELPLVECATRWELPQEHPRWAGIDESMSIDQSKHSLFGASKLAADVLVQEYGRYFGMPTMVFRGGCLTGPRHRGAELHGFLAYLVRCIVTGHDYRVYGYKAKQVRDNIHASDLVEAFWHAFQSPRPGEVYNIGGSRASNISMLEAISRVEELVGTKARWTYVDEPRSGDHIWYVSDVRKFRSHYPAWEIRHGIDAILREIIEGAVASV